MISAFSRAVSNVNLLPPADASAWKTWTAVSRFVPRGEVEWGTVSEDTKEASQETAKRQLPTFVLHSKGTGTNTSWTTLIKNVEPGKHYEFSVWQRTRGIRFDNVHVPIILSWCGSDTGEGDFIQRDYVDRHYEGQTGEGWKKRWHRIQAPLGTRSLRIDLSLRWIDGGSAWWHTPELIEVAAPKPRAVRIATTRIRPEFPTTVEKNMQLIADMFERVAREQVDLILFSENLVDRGVGLPPVETSQPIPGPLTDLLSEKARRHRTWAAISLHEVDECGHVYNTAVLIDREGVIVGKYRKTHLSMNETQQGVVPGDEYVVVDTDFGRIGLLICWDYWFPEPARILSLRGAEIILLPIAGDGVPEHWDAVSRARAMDNGVYLIASATVGDTPSCIINPEGKVLARTTGNFDYVVREIDLNKQWRVNWLSVGPGMGEAKSLYQQERRQDTYAPLSQLP